MYCVIKSVVHIGDKTEANGLPRRYAYLAGTKSIAYEYLKKIYQRDLESISKNKECEILGYGINDISRRASIEYIDNRLLGDVAYQYTYTEYMAIEGREIVKLKSEE